MCAESTGRALHVEHKQQDKSKSTNPGTAKLKVVDHRKTSIARVARVTGDGEAGVSEAASCGGVESRGVAAAVVSLTPVWIAYGCLGALLTRPSASIARAGLQTLAALGLWIFLQGLFRDSEGETHEQLGLAGWIVALVLVQWKLDQLLVFHVNQKPEERRIDVAGVAMLVAFAAASVYLREPALTALREGKLSTFPIFLTPTDCDPVRNRMDWNWEIRSPKVQFLRGWYLTNETIAKHCSNILYALRLQWEYVNDIMVEALEKWRKELKNVVLIILYSFSFVGHVCYVIHAEVSRTHSAPCSYFTCWCWTSASTQGVAVGSSRFPLPLEIASNSDDKTTAFLNRPRTAQVDRPLKMLRMLRPVAATTGTRSVVVDAHSLLLLRPGAEAVLLAAGVATEGRLWHWVPASYAKLEEAERKILTRAIPTPFEMKKVAQLGTVVVPCSDEQKRAQAKNLVLIHGFAGGNAVWAMVATCGLLIVALETMC
ncbi:unnamed protein product [Phytophthora lilii]|uniref:Unnamed protein product n=1 Tax=Phytophthora lilii TaxID=2077276 RepID=A0A9W6WPX8_9STRA|nr:unnamed protein product [Phytophthora lilii]